MKLTPKLAKLYQSLQDQKISGTEGPDASDLRSELEALSDMLESKHIPKVLEAIGLETPDQTRANIVGDLGVCRCCGQPLGTSVGK